MTSFLTDYAANQFAKVFSPTTLTAPAGFYVAVFTTAPTTGGTGGVEVSGGSYARPTFTPTVTGRSGVNSTSDSIASMPACTPIGVGIYDAATLGNLWWYGDLDTPVTIAAGGTFPLAIADLTYTF